MRYFILTLTFIVCIIFTNNAEAYHYRSFIAVQAALISMEVYSPDPDPVPLPGPDPGPLPEPEPTPTPKTTSSSQRSNTGQGLFRRR